MAVFHETQGLWLLPFLLVHLCLMGLTDIVGKKQGFEIYCSLTLSNGIFKSKLKERIKIKDTKDIVYDTV